MRYYFFLFLCLSAASLTAQSGPNPTDPILAYRATEATYDLNEFSKLPASVPYWAISI